MDASNRSVFDFVEVAKGGVGFDNFGRQEFGKGVVRYGEDVGVGRFLAIVVEADCGNGVVFDLDPADWRAKRYFGSLSFDESSAAIVELGERYDGNSHAVATTVGEERLPENVDSETRVGLVKFLVEGADEDDAPEAIDGALRLALLLQPLEHGDAFGGVKASGAAGTAAGAENREHRAADVDFVGERKRREFRERASHVKWRRENASFHLAFSSLRVEEEQAIEEFHFVCGTDAAIEIVKIGAAAQRNVLAIIDVFAVGQHVGGCAAAEEGTLFEE